MAAGTMNKPGTKYGPCKDACKHLDCAETRTMADTMCGYCRAFIGYEARFYRVDGLDLVHADCHEDAVDSKLRSAAK